MDHCQVMTTTDSAEKAEDLARGILESRLGACVQIVGPVRSIYRWDGEVQADQEWQCVIKTTTARLDELVEHIRSNHDYDVPEIIATPIVGGNAAYLAWMDTETTN